uniref:Uncharacterized protein n=1 Tax=Romanomermis culicivorax TaxID=13658 RepID=A0A915HEP0_ROMCU
MTTVEKMRRELEQEFKIFRSGLICTLLSAPCRRYKKSCAEQQRCSKFKFVVCPSPRGQYVDKITL